jgi:hypothetical protein
LLHTTPNENASKESFGCHDDIRGRPTGNIHHSSLGIRGISQITRTVISPAHLSEHLSMNSATQESKYIPAPHQSLAWPTLPIQYPQRGRSFRRLDSGFLSTTGPSMHGMSSHGNLAIIPCQAIEPIIKKKNRGSHSSYSKTVPFSLAITCTFDLYFLLCACLLAKPQPPPWHVLMYAVDACQQKNNDDVPISEMHRIPWPTTLGEKKPNQNCVIHDAIYLSRTCACDA